MPTNKTIAEFEFSISAAGTASLSESTMMLRREQLRIFELLLTAKLSNIDGGQRRFVRVVLILPDGENESFIEASDQITSVIVETLPTCKIGEVYELPKDCGISCSIEFDDHHEVANSQITSDTETLPLSASSDNDTLHDSPRSKKHLPIGRDSGSVTGNDSSSISIEPEQPQNRDQNFAAVRRELREQVPDADTAIQKIADHIRSMLGKRLLSSQSKTLPADVCAVALTKGIPPQVSVKAEKPLAALQSFEQAELEFLREIRSRFSDWVSSLEGLKMESLEEARELVKGLKSQAKQLGYHLVFNDKTVTLRATQPGASRVPRFELQSSGGRACEYTGKRFPKVNLVIS